MRGYLYEMGIACRGLVLLLSGFLLTGCGYHFRATGEPLGIKIETLAIPLMDSTSSNLGFEADFTRVIREEFISFGRVPLVSEEKAQAVLTGRIYDVRTEPLTYDLQQQIVAGTLTTHEITSRRRLRIKLEAQLTDRHTGRVIWRDEQMEEKASFVVDPDPLVTRFNERQALLNIGRELAKRIFLKTLERF